MAFNTQPKIPIGSGKSKVSFSSSLFHCEKVIQCIVKPVFKRPPLGQKKSILFYLKEVQFI